MIKELVAELLSNLSTLMETRVRLLKSFSVQETNLKSRLKQVSIHSPVDLIAVQWKHLREAIWDVLFMSFLWCVPASLLL